MRSRFFVAIVSALVLSGCATQKTVHLVSSFDEPQAKRLLEAGTATVKGSALLRQLNGGVVTCAGNEVRLVPATAYAKERATLLYGSALGGINPMNALIQPIFVPNEPTYAQLVRLTRCDAQGFFRFENLSAGEFYVTTHVSWQTGPYDLQGGLLSQLIQINKGESKEIVLTR